jgi:hypothetical protein
LVVALFSEPVAGFIAITVAPGIMAPLGSVSTPEILPVVAAHSNPAERRTNAAERNI